jgi:hypothetical protein
MAAEAKLILSSRFNSEVAHIELRSSFCKQLATARAALFIN